MLLFDAVEIVEGAALEHEHFSARVRDQGTRHIRVTQ